MHNSEPDPNHPIPNPNPGPNPIPDPPPVRYRECQRNHAARLGTHVVDGCGEFMPAGDGDSPGALQCAACNCHRNFHRKEVSGEPPPPPVTANRCFVQQGSNPSWIPSHTPEQRVPARSMVAFGGAAAESSSEDLNLIRSYHGEHQFEASNRKRSRTKFTEEQKNRMMQYAVKLGWRIQNQDEREVQQFCDEIGVKRQVFKVWIHNNKQASKRKQS